MEIAVSIYIALLIICAVSAVKKYTLEFVLAERSLDTSHAGPPVGVTAGRGNS